MKADLCLPPNFPRRTTALVLAVALLLPMLVAFGLAGFYTPGTGLEQVKSMLEALIVLAVLGMILAFLLAYAITGRLLWWATLLGLLPALARGWNIYQSS